MQVGDFDIRKGGNLSPHRSAFRVNSAASLASSVRHHDPRRACAGGA